MTGSPWWRALPAVEAWVPCGESTHPVRWADGELSLPAHGDAESEAVLAALGGDRAACLEVAETWHRHRGDLEMLAVGPRGPDDDVGVGWDEVREFREQRLGGSFTRRLPGGGYVSSGGPLRGAPRPGSRPMIPAGGGGGGLLGGLGPGLPAELEQLRTERLEMLILLALGPPFHRLLSGLIAAAFAPGGERAAQARDHRPALEAALTGRLAPAAETWLGIDPDLVDVRLHEETPQDGPGGAGGWGELELTGSGAGLRLNGALPVGWLASVWAPGLAVVGQHLVVAVEQAAFPEATVLALPAPGRAPVRRTVRATGDGGTHQWAHWEITERKETT
jgi:hypothetical protein